MRFIYSFMFVLFVVEAMSQTTDVTFDVVFKGNSIGTLQASSKKTGPISNINLKADTDARILILSVHVESEVTLTKDGDDLVKGVAYRHSNHGPDDVHATVTRIRRNTYRCEQNGNVTVQRNTPVTFCTTDLYFREPIGLTKVYSVMFAQFLPVKVVSENTYEVINPEKRSTVYHYSNGKLVTIEMDTPVGSVISTRK